MAGEYVRARLRQRDQDISTWLEDMIANGHDEADLVRSGLRFLMNQESPTQIPAQVKRLVKEKVTPKINKPVLKEVQQDNMTSTCVDDLLSRF